MPMPASRKELTHDRILDVAARAIRRAGYDGVGLASIMKEAGLTHGGFYAHFASRDALLAEATQRAGRATGAVLAERLRLARADGVSPFSALVHTYLADAQLENAECGCVVAALASEIPRQAEAVAGAARARVLGLVELVRRALPAGVDPAQAQVVAATMVGALQLARTLQGKAGRAWLANVRASLMQQYDA
ncbi:MAG: TetR/AcrR family transcriptional regulator [Burkholderiales bacterium]|nr:TetR/AcrR family transcriptional regulator [Burkholderiales bacterium]MDE1926479.1 TetR/AcrR family transcriptional regulator [Burkholderiales bacterium]MDE2159973.1 TetR/AcrR family transcriptional regulator [Burkholderiales bacterium]MDE2504392.1 TetR/AcrR family transcriptional regulator [Burkholderiales bacterium]